jgi:hypothetical protein
MEEAVEGEREEIVSRWEAEVRLGGLGVDVEDGVDRVGVTCCKDPGDEAGRVRSWRDRIP